MAKSKSPSYVVKESRVFRGRQFHAGEVFDLKAADCSEAEAATWHAQGLLWTAEEYAAAVSVSAAAKTVLDDGGAGAGGEKTEGDVPK